jgi:hypothetical protein
MPVLGIEAAIAALTAAQVEFIATFSVKVRQVVNQVHKGVLSRHPVWSGESISAWHWSSDGVGGGEGAAAEQKYSKEQIATFGHTGGAALGSEPMRAQATAAVDAEVSNLVNPADPFHEYVLSNDNPRTEMLEYGELPTSKRSRSPGGMIRITESEVQAMIGLL